MDLRRNPRVFRAWRVERLKKPSTFKAVSNGRGSKRKKAVFKMPYPQHF
jgi:hypothetical protein